MKKITIKTLSGKKIYKYDRDYLRVKMAEDLSNRYRSTQAEMAELYGSPISHTAVLSQLLRRWENSEAKPKLGL